MVTIPLPPEDQEAAQRMILMMDHATQQVGWEYGAKFVAVEGVWEASDAGELAVWGGHMKIAFKDSQPKTEEEREARRQLAPQASTLRSKCYAKKETYLKTEVLNISRT